MITRQHASEIKRLAALYAGVPYLAAYSQEYVDRQAALHAYIDALVGEDAGADTQTLMEALKQAARDLDHAADLIESWGGLASTTQQAVHDLEAAVSQPRRSAAALLALVATRQEG